MTEKHHILKTWDGKDYSCIKEKKYIAVDAVKEWANKEAAKYPNDLGVIASLVKLLKFIEDES